MDFTARELNLLSNTDVLGYIQAKNAERNAQAKAEGWEFWTLMAEELAEEVDNVYELELRFARGTYADIHKDYIGRKGYVSNELTLEQVERQIEMLSEEANRAYQAEQEWARELDRIEREEVALGMKRPASDMKLEQWEIYEAKAEAAGY